jgi:hypothetical protein
MANTAEDGRWPWPYADPDEMMRHGVCGDPYGLPEYEKFGEIVSHNVYEEGSAITVEVAIKAHHKGHVEFRLCEVAPWEATSCPASSLPDAVDQTCLNEHILLRTAAADAMSGFHRYGETYWANNTAAETDDDSTCNGVDLSNHTALGNAAEKAQYDRCWPERFYLGNRRTTPSNPEGRGWLATFQVKLPAGLTCGHCVMQMLYVTSNSCSPPGYRPAINYMTDQSNVAICGTTVDDYPEEFWNCADVQIRPSTVTDPVTVPQQSVCSEKVYGTHNIFNPPSCSDGIQNQDETGIDCGGVCSPCSDVTGQCDDYDPALCDVQTEKDPCNALGCCAWTGGKGPKATCIFSP